MQWQRQGGRRGENIPARNGKRWDGGYSFGILLKDRDVVIGGHRQPASACLCLVSLFDKNTLTMVLPESCDLGLEIICRFIGKCCICNGDFNSCISPSLRSNWCCAGAGRSAAALIQAATRSCFFAGFAAQRNFAEAILVSTWYL
ncbi:hypothetical protein RHSIM_Rhsim07G0189300 [Rhododendron simsii]|uniref:Uncharacterized protein n=1 Tax=Rhododendron simsii TaxID=118357 RepID=A0A834GQQ3_RHOSS|nr:hypothetical protein RHSIM_Rhsim07G0189300 [Rhododendron simsii]